MLRGRVRSLVAGCVGASGASGGAADAARARPAASRPPADALLRCEVFFEANVKRTLTSARATRDEADAVAQMVDKFIAALLVARRGKLARSGRRRGFFLSPAPLPLILFLTLTQIRRVVAIFPFLGETNQIPHRNRIYRLWNRFYRQGIGFTSRESDLLGGPDISVATCSFYVHISVPNQLRNEAQMI